MPLTGAVRARFLSDPKRVPYAAVWVQAHDTHYRFRIRSLIVEHPSHAEKSFFAIEIQAHNIASSHSFQGTLYSGSAETDITCLGPSKKGEAVGVLPVHLNW
jgi:hypothetical protein